MKLGNFDTDTVPGMRCILDTWPMAPVDPDIDNLPYGDGAVFNRSHLGSLSWTFTLQIDSGSVAAVLGTAADVSAALHPSLGLQKFSMAAAPGFEWQAVALKGPSWKRDKILWYQDTFCRLMGSITLTTPNPYGYATPDEHLAISAAGTSTLTRTKGNVPSFPRIEVAGTLTAAQAVTVMGVSVDGPLASNQLLVLDYDAMDFGVWEGNTKISSVVGRMSSLARPSLKVGANQITASGVFSQIDVYAKSRRV